MLEVFLTVYSMNIKQQLQQMMALGLGHTPDAMHDASVISELGVLGLICQVDRIFRERKPLLESSRKWVKYMLEKMQAHTFKKQNLHVSQSYQIVVHQKRFLQEFLGALTRECDNLPGAIFGFQDLCRFISEDKLLSEIKSRIVKNAANDPSHDENHCLRVAMWAVFIKENDVEKRDLVAAALLHDIVNLPKGHAHARDASRCSANAAKNLLLSLGFATHERLQLIGQAIEDHSFSRGRRPSSDLGKALQDADRLDALGSIGIIRLFAVGAQMKSSPIDVRDPFAEKRALDDKKYSLDHFFTKLHGLSKTMNTVAGEKEALLRMNIIHRFISALANALGLSFHQNLSSARKQS